MGGSFPNHYPVPLQVQWAPSGPPTGHCGVAAEYRHYSCLQVSDLATKPIGLLKFPGETSVPQRYILWSHRGGKSSSEGDEADESGVK